MRRPFSGTLLIVLGLALATFNYDFWLGIEAEPAFLGVPRFLIALLLFSTGLAHLARATRPVERPAGVGRYFVLTLLGLIFIFPVFWMFTTSLKPPYADLGRVMPEEVQLENYPDAMTYAHGAEDPEFEGAWAPGAFFRTPFFQQLVNTLTVGLLGTVGVVISSSLAAYAFARLEWPGRDFFFVLTVATMMVPFAVLVVPLYGLFRQLGWIGTLRPLWAPACFGTGFSIFLLRQFFKGIPNDLTDAARIDGCSEFGIYWKIVMPLAKPALAAVALFHFLYVWNDFFAPLVFLTETETFTLALGLHQFQGAHGGTPWTLMMTAATLMTLPILIIFFLTQRVFVRGVTMSGLKS